MCTLSILRRVFAFPMVLALVSFAVPLPHAAAAIAPSEHLVVYKSRRVLQLLKGNEVVRSYQCAIGRNPLGHKQRAGDCRTPEGTYIIDRHKKDSRFYKSLHISYPNSRDLVAARNHGHSPGGDIMIHGLPKEYEELADFHFRRNWTKGCIAVNNAEMDEIWAMVPDGTPIEIRP